jgi:hypothetical protein
MLFAALTGRLPFEGEAAEILDAKLIRGAGPLRPRGNLRRRGALLEYPFARRAAHRNSSFLALRADMRSPA